MGLQDKIFDVENFLEENADEGLQKDFDAIITHLYRLEARVEKQAATLSGVEKGIAALRELGGVQVTYTVEIVAEWVDAAMQERKARANIAKASKEQVARGEAPLDLDHELREYPLDWADPETCMQTRKFPSIGMAVGWAKKNCTKALWHSVDIFVNHVSNEDPWNAETVEHWRVDDGVVERLE